ncbi:MAG TPA: hypothetical protein VLY24_12410 [Bryobacteraceae bacterium]|nr:hypothetical protein [Bryobacteraceae bacterium]
MGEPESRSTGLAPFLDASKAQDGNPRSFVPSLAFRFAIRIPLSCPVDAAPLPNSPFSSLILNGADDASVRHPHYAATESYSSFEQNLISASAALPLAQLGRAVPAASDSPAAIAPDSRTDALETSPANTWLAPCPPLQAPTELPPVRGVSGLREHPLASPMSISYSIAYRSTRSASLSESSLAQGPQAGPALPDLQLAPLPSEQLVEASRPLVPRSQVEQFAAGPAAAPAASLIQPSVQAPFVAEYAPFVPRGPRLTPVVYPAATHGTMPPPVAQPVEMSVQPVASTSMVGMAAAVEAPQITGLQKLPVFERAINKAWLPGLPSQPAARMVRTSQAAAVAFAQRPIQFTAFRVPLAKAVQPSEQTAQLAESFPVPAPVPVEAAPTARAHSPAAISLTRVRLASFTLAPVGGSPAEPASFVAGLSALPVEAARTAPALAPAAIAVQPVLVLPQAQLVPDLHQPACGSAGFERQTATAAIPPTRALHRSAALDPLPSGRPLAVPIHPAAAAPVMPACPARPTNLLFSKVTGSARSDIKWFSRDLDLVVPRFGLRPVFEPIETFVDVTKLNRKRANVFDFAEYAQLRKHKPVLQHAGKAIAASLLVGVGLWFGSHAANLGRRIVSRDATSELARIENSARVAAIEKHQSSVHLTPVAWAKGAIAKRAAVQVTDSFAEGMRAWGAAAKSWAPGWSRNPDGYVTPGQLALLKPTLSYTDYRLEFFGEIEKKGMSWAVRAKDPDNYYAMKFKVVEPGLRPVLSMVHYAVVGGKAGRKVEVPLSVMVHNNTAYHVAVQVRGHQYTASIEGQEVESWMDDALPSGGVGFFSEAGERARLYWMKVSKNDDWLGRVCAFLSGSSVEDSQQAAWLERQQAPGPAPSRREPGQSEAVLVAVGASEFLSGRPQRTASRASSPGRNQIWNS